jgi:hypothetical protein
MSAAATKPMAAAIGGACRFIVASYIWCSKVYGLIDTYCLLDTGEI